jgi:hypothetical protein
MKYRNFLSYVAANPADRNASNAALMLAYGNSVMKRSTDSVGLHKVRCRRFRLIATPATLRLCWPTGAS